MSAALDRGDDSLQARLQEACADDWGQSNTLWMRAALCKCWALLRKCSPFHCVCLGAPWNSYFCKL